MSEHDGILFAELLCARLCHDMAGAVGAAAAGAELLEDGLDAETAQLVAASAASAAARLKFFRAALGPAGSEQSAAVIRDLAAAYLHAAESGGGRLTLRWSCDRPRLDGDMTRLALNLVLVARDSLPRGGTISVSITTGVSVTFQGEGGGLGDDLTATLLAGDAPTNPRAAQAWFTRRLADKIGAALQFDRWSDGGRITI